MASSSRANVVKKEATEVSLADARVLEAIELDSNFHCQVFADMLHDLNKGKIKLENNNDVLGCPFCHHLNFGNHDELKEHSRVLAKKLGCEEDMGLGSMEAHMAVIAFIKDGAYVDEEL